MFGAKVHSEQERSLASKMQAAGLKHGDTADVRLTGVGVKTGGGRHRTLCFCPTDLQVVGAAKQGLPHERAKPMPLEVTYTPKALRAILVATPTVGFLTIVTKLHSNGTINFDDTKVERFEPALGCSVSFPESYRSFQVVKAGS